MFKYLRVSVTDRCNYRCIYCMPESGVCKQSHEQIMRYEEILNVIAAAVETGVEQVRITGGEPLVRAGIVDLISDAAAINGLADLSLTTNGALLPVFAGQLKKAGLKRVNISLDSLNPETFIRITRNGSLSEVVQGVDAARSAGLDPVKINVVLIPGINDNEVLDFADFAVAKGIWVRFIERMPFNLVDEKDIAKNEYISEEDVIGQIQKKYQLELVESNSFGPARNFRITGSNAGVGFISSRSQPFCSQCRRLRLTSNGTLLPCLDSATGVQLKGMSKEDVKNVIDRLDKEKASWEKRNACFVSPFHNSLSKIGG